MTLRLTGPDREDIKLQQPINISWVTGISFSVLWFSSLQTSDSSHFSIPSLARVVPYPNHGATRGGSLADTVVKNMEINQACMGVAKQWTMACDIQENTVR